MVEVDELYQNAGEKGERHADPLDPPRRRANKQRGHGTWDHDRPPIVGVMGRETGCLYLEVVRNSDRATLQPLVEATTLPTATVQTDEWKAYSRLKETGRTHQSVNHSPGKREWARDDDGDGVREVHVNTAEGNGTGVRNFLRPFRGVHKRYLQQYVAVYEWSHNRKQVFMEDLRQIMCPFTSFVT